MESYIQLRHGDGGWYTSKLIKEIFYQNFYNETLIHSEDAAVVTLDKNKAAFTTDSFVVKPLVFPGGDIGKLSICGTINDLAAVGAKPLYISAGFIIEEGFSLELLDKISHSMGKICRQNRVKIVTGDTKVVEKGAVDGLFINTAGIGVVHDCYQPRALTPDDEIIITGGIAEHGTVILSERYNLQIENAVHSDCNPLCSILTCLEDDLQYVKLMRDPTRGGLATALCDIAEKEKIGMLIDENQIPIHRKVQAVHKLLGTDPLYFASEGRMILVVEKGQGERIREKLRKLPIAEETQIIGACTDKEFMMVRMRTSIGGIRIVTGLDNQIIPRIC